MKEERSRDFRVEIEKPEYSEKIFPGLTPHIEKISEGWLLMVNQNGLGQGNKDLGQTLLSSFFYHLDKAARLPRCIIFIHGGVNCTCSGSPLLDYLASLEQQGVEIVSCRTSLELSGLQNSLCVGFSAPMPLLVERISQAVQIVNL